MLLIAGKLIFVISVSVCFLELRLPARPETPVGMM